MNETKRLYCYLEIADIDNTISCDKQWKLLFVSYLNHILQNNYKITLHHLTHETLSSTENFGDEDVFLYLKVLSNTSSEVTIPSIASGFSTVECIGILKEPLENILASTIPFRLFDLCPIDPETGLPIKAEELFEKENLTIFLSKISDLSFEINLLFNGQSAISTPFIYLAETSYELSSIRYSVKKELIKRGYRVLPEKNFPLEEEELQDFIQQDLKQAVLSVHFFGNHHSVPHPQTGLQMDVLQNMLAANYYKAQSSLIHKGENITSDFRRIIWMPENPRIKNEKYLKFVDALKHDYALYAGSDLIRSSPEELKDIIIQKLSGHNSKAEAPPAAAFSATEATELSEQDSNTSRVEDIPASPQHNHEKYLKLIYPEESNSFQL